MERQLSDTARKVLEKQLQLLSEHDGESSGEHSGERAMAILKLVEVLEADDQCKERNARWDAHFEGMRRYEKEQEPANQREQNFKDDARKMLWLRVLPAVGGFVGGAIFTKLFLWLLQL